MWSATESNSEMLQCSGAREKEKWAENETDNKEMWNGADEMKWRALLPA